MLFVTIEEQVSVLSDCTLPYRFAWVDHIRNVVNTHHTGHCLTGSSAAVYCHGLRVKEQFSNWNNDFLEYFIPFLHSSLTSNSDGCIVIIPLSAVIVQPTLSSGNIIQVSSYTFQSSNILVFVSDQPVTIF